MRPAPTAMQKLHGYRWQTMARLTMRMMGALACCLLHSIMLRPQSLAALLLTSASLSA